MHDQTTTGPPSRPIRTADRQPVAALSAAVLVTARIAYGEDRADLAARTRLAVHVVDGVESGTRPAWALPYPEFMAIAEAVAAPHPSWRELFETAAACDLLMTCLLDGDQAMATDVLADDDTRDTTVALLRWAITGDSRSVQRAGLTPWERADGPSGRLLNDEQRAPLRQRAAALARSSSPDAWVGAEILAIFGTDR
jgi:hypothetical protein